MTKEELLDLLREARKLIHTTLVIDALHDWACESDGLDDAMRSLRTSINAALAERQDSAKDVVESEPVDWGAPDRFQIAHVGSFVAEVFPDRDGKGWVWAIARRDNANTEAEAKSAAIAAARGMK
jgi:hypothetical protein